MRPLPEIVRPPSLAVMGGAFVVNTTLHQMQDMIALRAMLGGMTARYVTANGDLALYDDLMVPMQKMRLAQIRRRATCQPPQTDG